MLTKSESKNLRFSSRALRNILATLLVGMLLPLATLALSHDHPVDRFEQQIKAFETRDKKEAPKPGGTVFVGSSTFVHWRNLETDLKDLDAINRGFGGSTIPEVNHYIDRIVINYKPAQVVFYAGTNDLAEGHSAQRVCDDFMAFATKVHKALPKTQIYFVSMSVAPVRLNLKPAYEEGNELVLKQVEKAPYLHYVDVIPAMRTTDGKLRDDYFLPDKLHMTSVGYEKWTPIIRSALIKGGAVVKETKDSKASVAKGSVDSKTAKDDVAKPGTDPRAVKDSKETVKTVTAPKTETASKADASSKVDTAKAAPAAKAESTPKPAETAKAGAETKVSKDAGSLRDPKTGK